jgi:hypothetical protein
MPTDKVTISLILLISIMAVMPLAFTKYPPLQDYPDWLYQGHILADYQANKAVYSEHIAIKPYLVPNSASPLVMAFFMRFVSPILAGKLTLCLWLLGMPICYLYFYRSFNPKGNILQFVPLLFLYNIRFYHGNLSFLLSLPLSFFIVGYFQRRLNKFDLFQALTISIFLVLLFSFHFIGFVVALSGIFIIAASNYKLRLRQYIWPGAAMMPALMLAAIYALNQSGHGDQLAFNLHWSILGKVANIFATWAIAFGFDNEPVSIVIIFKILLNLLFFAIVVYVIYNFVIAIRKGNIKWNAIAILGFIMIFIALFLPTMFFYITDADWRLYFIGALFVIPIIDSKKFAINRKNLIGFLGLFSMLIILNSWQFYSKDRQNSQIVNRIEDCIGPNKNVLTIMGDFIYEDYISANEYKISRSELAIRRLAPQTSSLMRLPYYYYLANNIPYYHIFQTSLLESKNFRIPLMVKPWPSPQQILSNIDEFEYVVIVGRKRVVNYFIEYLSPRSQILCTDSNYAILKIEK